MVRKSEPGRSQFSHPTTQALRPGFRTNSYSEPLPNFAPHKGTFPCPRFKTVAGFSNKPWQVGSRLRPPAERGCGGAARAVKSNPDVILHRGGYPGWPWVARARERRLVCVFRDDGIHGFSPTGKVLWTESRDEGKTWAVARVVAEEAGVDDRNAAVVQLPDGTLMVCYNTYTRTCVSRPMVTWSKDDGATLEQAGHGRPHRRPHAGAPIVVASGVIVIPIYKAPGKRVSLRRDPAMPAGHGNFPRAGRAGVRRRRMERDGGGEGRIVGILRNNGSRDGYFWKTESRDGGRTWDRPVKTNVQSARAPSPAHLDRHGKLPLLTYADRRMVSVSMVVTRDPDLRIWDVDGRFPVTGTGRMAIRLRMPATQSPSPSMSIAVSLWTMKSGLKASGSAGILSICRRIGCDSRRRTVALIAGGDGRKYNIH